MSGASSSATFFRTHVKRRSGSQGSSSAKKGAKAGLGLASLGQLDRPTIEEEGSPVSSSGKSSTPQWHTPERLGEGSRSGTPLTRGDKWEEIDDFSPLKLKTAKPRLTPRLPPLDTGSSHLNGELWKHDLVVPSGSGTLSAPITAPITRASLQPSLLSQQQPGSPAFFPPQGDTQHYDLSRRKSDTRLSIAPSPTLPQTSFATYSGHSPSLGEASVDQVSRGSRSTTPIVHDDDDDKSKKLPHGTKNPNVLSPIVVAGKTILQYIMQTSGIQQHIPTKPPTSGVSKILYNAKWLQPERKPHILLRLFIIFYICSSLLYFTSSIFLTSPKSYTTRPLSASDMDIMDSSLPLMRNLDEEGPKWSTTKDRIYGVYRAAANILGASTASSQDSSSKTAGDFSRDSALSSKLAFKGIPEVRRTWGDNSTNRHPAQNPLSAFSLAYRFSKMSSKIDTLLHNQIDPYAFEAADPAKGGNVTACLYFNEAWISQLPEFVKHWHGPMSIVFEVLGSREDEQTQKAIESIDRLRSTDPYIRSHADFHLVYTPAPATELLARQARARLLVRPVASNFHLNLARFFARTDTVWLQGDARVTPSKALRRKLNTMPQIRRITLDKTAGIVIPTFAMIRRINSVSRTIPSLEELRQDESTLSDDSGIGEMEFEDLAAAYVASHYSTLPLSPDSWPQRKAILVGLASNHPPASLLPEELAGRNGPLFTLFDRSWDNGKGPTNFKQWRKPVSIKDADEGAPLEAVSADLSMFYQVMEDDLHYAPSLVIARDRQPWCTERFEYNMAACRYQMYLSGARMYVMPDEWAVTLESIDKREKEKKTESEKLKSSISARLYTKFRSEACMHYGRAFLSMDLWDTERSQNLRYSCARILASYGIGNFEEAQGSNVEQSSSKKKAKTGKGT